MGREKLNTIEELESEISTSRNETVFKINVGLHMADVHSLHDVIINYVKNNAVKSRSHIEEFNKEISG